MSSGTLSLSFSPGPLGFEVEPVWQAGEKSVGCRVAGFQNESDGSVGQAERFGKLKNGDILTDINGVPVRGMPFDKIIDLLRQDATRAERRLSFQSSHTATTAPASPSRQQPDLAPKNAGRAPDSVLETPLATPSPQPHPLPAAPSGENEATTAERLRIAKEGPQSRSLGWAMDMLGMRRQRQERGEVGLGDDGANAESRESEILPLLAGYEDGVPLMPQGRVVDTDKEISDGHDSRAKDFENGAPTGAGGLDKEGDGGEMRSDVFTFTLQSPDTAAETNGGRVNNRREVEGGFPANAYVGSGAVFGMDEHAGGSQVSATFTSRPVDALGGSYGFPGEVISPGQTLEVLTTADDSEYNSNDYEYAEHSSYLSQMLAASMKKSGTLSNVEPTLTADEYSGDPSSRLRPTENVVRHAATIPSNSVFGMTNQAVTRVLPGSHALERPQAEAGNDEQSLRGRPETTDQSLDTISLLSEPVDFAGKSGSTRKRRWMIVPHLWGRGAGQPAAGGSPDASVNEDREGDGEAEEARRLARSLAAKLNERARRCEELQDLCALRDDQVAMLQRQSNALAGQAAALSEQLSDQEALTYALQQERARLEEELTQEEDRRHDTDSATSNIIATPTSTSAAIATPSAVMTTNTGNKLHHVAGGEYTDVVDLGTVHDEMARLAEPAEAAQTERSAAAARKAQALTAAAEARASALGEMVDGLVAEKVQWEEERAARSLEAMRLRARARGLEDALAGTAANHHGGGSDGDKARKEQKRGDDKLRALRELLRSRTRELEAEHGVTERLAARVRELKRETRQLYVSLAAREADVLASDREMEALSGRLNEELRERDVALTRAQAEAGELRQALEVAMRSMRDSNGGNDGSANTTDDYSARLIAETLQWVEERTRLQHNLLSLQSLLEERDATAMDEEKKSTLLLKTLRDERDWLKTEIVSLRNASESLRVELSEALSSLAENQAGAFEKAASEEEEEGGGSGQSLTAANETSASQAIGDCYTNGVVDKVQSRGAGQASVDAVHGKQTVSTVGGAREHDHQEENEGFKAETADLRDGGSSDGGRDAIGGVAADGDDREGIITAAARGGGAVDLSDRKHRGHLECLGKTAAQGQGSGLWLGGGFDGSVDELQLDLMEKDIVIEQLRVQVKHLRARISAMEDEQAADTSPLQGLLVQLGELKGTVQEREEREQHCRDQVDQGLMRMERLKEESTKASPPLSCSGSATAGPSLSVHADPSHHSDVERQRLRRQVEDLQWDIRTVKRRLEEREAQLRDTRAEADSLTNRFRCAERALATAESNAEVAAAEISAERRRAGACRTEMQALRAELRAVGDRAMREGEELRLKMEADVRERVAAAVAAAESSADEREAVLTAALKKSTMEQREREREREEELLLKHAGLTRSSLEGVSRHAADLEALAREIESVKCALAARDVELEAIVDATAGFLQQKVVDLRGKGVVGGYDGGGSGALRGALAAVTEARRAGRTAAELEEECASLKVKVAQERSDISRLRQALSESKAAEETAIRAAATAAATAATAVAARQAAVLNTTPQPAASAAEVWSETRGKADENRKRAVAAEDSLRKALTGAEQAWRLLTSCVTNESGIHDDLLDADAPASHPLPPLLPTGWRPESDAGLKALIESAEALASAHHRRGYALRRAKIALRAKSVCAREARRREAAQMRAREDAEARLRDALAALDECEQQQRDWRDGSGRRRVGSGPEAVARVAGGGEEMFAGLSAEQVKHLRRIRSEVDRLEGQNRTLRHSLASDRMMHHPTTTTRRDDGMPTQRMLFPHVIGDAILGGHARPEDDAEGWDFRPDERLSGSEQPASESAGSPSPARSWSNAIEVAGRVSQWKLEQAGVGAGKRRELGGDGGGGCTRVDESCTVRYQGTLQDERSGGTLVPGWQTEA